jgi:transcriptional regulator with XRE-family HTH domain
MISRKIRSYRIKNHFTQKEVADELGIKKSRVTAWESGLEEPTEKEIKKLSELFCVSPRVLRGLGNYKPIEIVKCNEDTKNISLIFALIGGVCSIIGLGMVVSLLVSFNALNNKNIEFADQNHIQEIFNQSSMSYFWTGGAIICLSIVCFIIYYILRHVRLINRKKK